uniref:Uncharacterized protein n=1 Tax=Romanomermis culicivorax TaxID=13658 RepID=A0A915IRE7_ROMCU
MKKAGETEKSKTVKDRSDSGNDTQETTAITVAVMDATGSEFPFIQVWVRGLILKFPRVREIENYGKKKLLRIHEDPFDW